MPAIAVFDAGKTRLKLSLVDEDGTVIAGRSATTPRTPGQQGWPWPSLDLRGIEAFLAEALSSLRPKAAFDRIVPVAHGAAIAWIEGTEPAAPPVDYEAEVPEGISRAYEAMRPDFAESGSPSLPRGLNLGRQLYWATQVDPSLPVRARLVTWPQYWALRLSGAAASERSMLGCHSDLWAARDDEWSSLARSMGWDRVFAPLRRAGEALGEAVGPAARAAGLAGGEAVLCGAHDSNAALHAVRASAAGRSAALVSTGTWFVIMAPGAAKPLDPGRDCLLNVAVDGTLVPTVRFMGGREHALLAGQGAAADAADCAALIGSGRLALPPLAPLGGPFMGRRGGIRGEAPTSAGGRAALGAAYLALITDYCLDLLGAAGPVVVEGPFARNAAGLGLLAALGSRTVLRSADDLVAVGAAALAFEGAAAGLSLEAVEPWEIAGWRDYAARWRRAAEAQDAEHLTKETLS